MSIINHGFVRWSVATVLLFAAVSAILLWYSRRPEVRLQWAREEAEAVRDSGNMRARELHGKKCIEISRTLIDRPDRIGYTASLFIICVAPETGEDISDVLLPSERQVETLLTPDLILISRLFFHTKRIAPSDQLIHLILSRKDDHRADALRLAIMVRFELGRDADVINHCDELSKLSPKDANPYRVKAMVHRNHGHWDHFIDAAEKAFELDGRTDAQLQIELIDGYVRLGQTQDARRELNSVTENNPELVAQIPVIVSRLLLQEGKNDDAFETNSHYLATSPDDVESLILHGQLLIGKAKFDEAIVALKHAIDLSPSEELAWFQLGQAYARTANAEEAQVAMQKHRSILDTKIQLNSLEALAAREPTNIIVRTELARLYGQLGNTELADFWTRAANAAQGK